MTPSHRLIIGDEYVSAIGYGKYFSWFLIPEHGEWTVVSHYGSHHATCKTFEGALKTIGYHTDCSEDWDMRLICRM